MADRPISQVRTLYYGNGGLLKEYTTKSETPFHADLRLRFDARTEFLYIDADRVFFGPYTEIVREIKSVNWDARHKQERDALAKRRADRKKGGRS
jgi:hypothetical protein